MDVKFETDSDTSLFTRNDLVVITPDAPLSYFPGKIAVVCGMEQVKSERLSSEFNIKMGDWLYNLEFGDGSSVEVPELYLEKYREV